MSDFYIKAENVFNTACFLAEASADQYSIKPNESEVSENFVVKLKDALYNFKHPFEGKISREYSPILLFDENLTELLRATKNVFDILTDDSKKFVQAYVEEKQKDFQGYHHKINKSEK